MVVRRGYVVAQIGDTSYVDEIASATKSFVSLLAGVAFDRELITDVHRSVYDDIRLELLSDEHSRRITWHHLLQQTSEWDGELFGKVPSGHRGERIGEPPHDPGTYWEYNDVRVNLLARCLLELFGRPLPGVLRDEIMGPIGASDSWSWHGYDSSWTVVNGQRVQSVSGGSHWGGGIWMNAQALARVGLLYLRDGVWGDQRLLSTRWIDMTRRPCDLNPMYGYTWWLQHDTGTKTGELRGARRRITSTLCDPRPRRRHRDEVDRRRRLAGAPRPRTRPDGQRTQPRSRPLPLRRDQSTHDPLTNAGRPPLRPRRCRYDNARGRYGTRTHDLCRVNCVKPTN